MASQLRDGEDWVKLPKVLTDHLAQHKWRAEGKHDWSKEGVLLSIYKSSMGRMYAVGWETPTVSGNDFVHEDRLLRIIEGKEKPNV